MAKHATPEDDLPDTEEMPVQSPSQPGPADKQTNAPGEQAAQEPDVQQPGR